MYVFIQKISNAGKVVEQLDLTVLVKLYRLSGKQFGSSFVCK